jgi:hypothetical protein
VQRHDSAPEAPADFCIASWHGLSLPTDRARLLFACCGFQYLEIPHLWLRLNDRAFPAANHYFLDPRLVASAFLQYEFVYDFSPRIKIEKVGHIWATKHANLVAFSGEQRGQRQ